MWIAKKFGFLLGLGTGYVLGAKAGRQRYEQIASRARGVWQDPRVQKKAGQAQDLAKEKAGQAGQIAMEKAGDAGHVVKEKVSERKGGTDTQGSSDTKGSTDSGTSSDQRGVGSGAPSSSDLDGADTPDGISVSEGGLTDPAADEALSKKAAGSDSGNKDSGDKSGSGSSSTTRNSPSQGTPPPDSPSAKLPPHPVAQPGIPGGSPS